MYARANTGHPPREGASFFSPTALTPMCCTRRHLLTDRYSFSALLPKLISSPSGSKNNSFNRSTPEHLSRRNPFPSKTPGRHEGKFEQFGPFSRRIPLNE